ncbi:hypothetical protein SETIT_2G088700v2 [Setaria italica]|uniref:Fe2OG dioxygenase domain-containing protein n=1 Tax=Setaria italica TaxID=4555 RepID=K4A362_SETIT|nr:hypothetical protein SETIT_2G088700v2 [Setaria italica]
MVHEAQRKLVQKVAAGCLGGAPPTKYVLREEDRPTSGVTATDLEFPTVDLRRLADPADVEEASKLRSALQSWGLFAVSCHGIPGALLDELLAVAREFFYRPPEEKLRHTNVVDADGGERFQPEGYGVDRIDSDEQLQVEPAEERRLQFWPSYPPSLRALLDEFTAKSGEQVARPMLGAMGRVLGFREEVFVDRLGGDRAATYARFTYYSPCPRPPHTNNSVVTVLLLDPDVGGLLVLKDGEWVNVPGLGHDLLVIVGDEMEIMSNGVFRAPMHRVVTSDKERVSLVMFYLPEPEKELEPVEELVDEARPAMYRKLKADTFADGFFDAFAAGERAIDFLKLRVQQEAAASTS